jgi:ligand-binding SRPBCC domain-containing protein
VKLREYRTELWLPQPPEEIFPFFANASNLNELTPPWLKFRILTPEPIRMQEGTLIDYALKIRGWPVRWRTRINVWEPPHRFVDEQLRGPYRRWIHEHVFEAREGGTAVLDLVRYAVPFDWAVHRLLVAPDIRQIFEFRAQALLKRFG